MGEPTKRRKLGMQEQGRYVNREFIETRPHNIEKELEKLINETIPALRKKRKSLQSKLQEYRSHEAVKQDEVKRFESLLKEKHLSEKDRKMAQANLEGARTSLAAWQKFAKEDVKNLEAEIKETDQAIADCQKQIEKLEDELSKYVKL